MSSSTTRPALYVKKVRGMGRGVFAGRPFRKGQVIEVCPVVPVGRGLVRKCRGEVMERYLFWWKGGGHVAAVCMGYGALYNHSSHPNAHFAIRPATADIVFRATRTIRQGEQIFIDYDWEAEDYDFPVAAVLRANGKHR
jgi:uncharacterized protein